MTDPTSPVRQAVLARLAFSAYDLPTRDKVPLLRELMRPEGEGLALDVGIGTGYTTYSVFDDRATVCVDLDLSNLRHYRDRVTSVPGARRPLCVVALADALPFKAAVFRFALCSEVLEHLEDDGAAVEDLARVLSADGKAVLTVPYSGLGFTSFLELCGIKTVHDFPGPEHHVRPGYDEQGLGALLERHGLVLERHTFYLRFFTRLAVDLVSLGHLTYQRIAYRRRAWTWSEAQAVADSPVFRLYTRLFGALRTFCRLDRLTRRARGFGLIVVARRPGIGGRPASGRDGLRRGEPPMTGKERWRRLGSVPWLLSQASDALVDACRAFSRTPFAQLYRTVRPYTMCGGRRLYGLYRAIEHVVTHDIPGSLVECGTARGGSAALMALTLERFGVDRPLWVFDTFEGLPPPTGADGDREITEPYTGRCGGTLGEVEAFFDRLGIRGQARLVKGLFHETLPAADVGAIAVLHIDCDWYESVKVCLEHLYDRVSPGGIIQIDDYGHWPGARKAVDEFRQRRAITTRLQRLDYTGRQLVKPRGTA